MTIFFSPNPQGLLKQLILPCQRRSTTVVRYYSKQTISVSQQQSFV